MIEMPASLEKLLEQVWDWSTSAEKQGGGKVAEDPWVQQGLARVYAKLEALKVMNWHSAWLIDQGAPGMAESSAVKVFGTETVIACYRDLLEITQQAGLVRRGEPGALFDGLLESAYRLAMVNTFGGGVNEVMRDIIAGAGLRLPRARR
jgi:alkylation response protein AidB-like acyl-CoA dehydrogenase